MNFTRELNAEWLSIQQCCVTKCASPKQLMHPHDNALPEPPVPEISSVTVDVTVGLGSSISCDIGSECGAYDSVSDSVFPSRFICRQYESDFYGLYDDVGLVKNGKSEVCEGARCYGDPNQFGTASVASEIIGSPGLRSNENVGELPGRQPLPAKDSPQQYDMTLDINTKNGSQSQTHARTRREHVDNAFFAAFGDRAETEDEDNVHDRWGNWRVRTFDSKFFWHKETKGLAQWRMPECLTQRVFGSFEEVLEGNASKMWWNETLQMRLPVDPEATRNVFRACFRGDLFYVHLFISALFQEIESGQVDASENGVVLLTKEGKNFFKKQQNVGVTSGSLLPSEYSQRGELAATTVPSLQLSLHKLHDGTESISEQQPTTHVSRNLSDKLSKGIGSLRWRSTPTPQRQASKIAQSASSSN